MSDGKIHIPARRKQPVDDQMNLEILLVVENGSLIFIWRRRLSGKL